MNTSFEEFLSTQTPTIDISFFILQVIITVALAFVLTLLYRKYAESFSNKKLFSRNFVLLALTTMLVISIVKSSLALSLGLVGALSIVRFRSAIKEPEELIFLFLSIGIGLGIGAHQILTTTVAMLFISLFLIGRHRFEKNGTQEANMVLIVSGDQSAIDAVFEQVKKTTSALNLKRYEQKDSTVEASFSILFANTEEFLQTKKVLESSDQKISFTFLDNTGIL